MNKSGRKEPERTDLAPFGYSCTVTLQIRQTGKRLSGKLGSVYVSGG